MNTITTHKENIPQSKQVLSIKIDPQLYQQLKTDIGKGRIGRFVENLIAQELQNQDQKLAQEYQAAAKDKRRWKETQEWEKAQIADWNKQDDGEND